MPTAPQSRSHSRSQSRTASRAQSPSRGSELGLPSLGRKLGPGHSPDNSERGRKRNRLNKPNPHRDSSAASQIGVAISAPLETSDAATPAAADNRVPRITEADNEDSIADSTDEYLITPEQAEANKKTSQLAALEDSSEHDTHGHLYQPSFAPDTTLSQNILADSPVASSGADEPLMPESAHVTGAPDGVGLVAASVAHLSFGTVVKDKKGLQASECGSIF